MMNEFTFFIYLCSFFFNLAFQFSYLFIQKIDSIHKNKAMKELSFFLLKNTFGSKMKKGFKNFCNNDASTSTLNQTHHVDAPSESIDCINGENQVRQPTLEEMILKLDLEEKMARRAELEEYYNETQPQAHHRMSCVSSSDILKSARNALNQYPRFSLDGKDAMYRSSFRNLAATGTGGARRKGSDKDVVGGGLVFDRTTRLPGKLGGESVIWCKPGVVGKLMGLDAMPMPVVVAKRRSTSSSCKDQRMMIKRQNLRKRAERETINGGDCVGMMCGKNNNDDKITLMGVSPGCYSTKKERCMVNTTPSVAMLELRHDIGGWPMRRFL